MPTSEPKSVERTNSGSVIVFDLATQTITTKKAKKFKDALPKPHPAPRFGNSVDIYDESRLIATLNLGKLGWFTTTKRLFGRCNQILVI